MRVLKNRAFTRFARKAKLEDATLCKVIEHVERGLIDADLGGGVIKQRVARSGEGKSGGFRVLVLYRRKDRAVFVHGFAKSEKPNISPDESSALKELADEVLNYDERAINAAAAAGVFRELTCNA